MKKILNLTFLFAAITLFAAEAPVMLDLNFDGHPDRMIVRGKAEVGSKYEIKLYDPQTKSYRFDPVFSGYIVGLPPELNTKEKTIQTWLQFQKFGVKCKVLGYKFLVKNGKLCFLSGKPLPEKLAWTLAGKLTPEMIAFDREAAGAEYTSLLKERRTLEKQFAASGIPYDKASAIRFYMDGMPENPQGFKDVKALADRMTEKMPLEIPARFPDAELRRQQKEYLASIADDWKKLEAILSSLPQRKSVWDPKKMLCNQSLPMFFISRDMARIFQMQMQSKMDTGNGNGALADFERSRILLLYVDGPIIAGLVATAVEAIRLEGLSDILSRGKLTPEQWRKLDDSLHQEEILLRKAWERAWYLECAWGLDVIGSFIEGTADQSLEKYRTPDGHVLFLFAVPWTREWIFLARLYQQILPELTGDKAYCKHPFPERFPEGFMLCPALIGLNFKQIYIRRFYGIAQIRAARIALRHLGLKSAETPLDPFTGKPLQLRQGEFKASGRMVRGIRFYSAGPDGKYTDGTYMKPDNKSDDIGFGLVEEVLK